MEALHEVTRTQLVAIFTEWEKRAEDGNWAGNEPNQEARADTFLEILDEVRSRGN